MTASAREMGIMQGFPPPPDKRPTLNNWDLPPFNSIDGSHLAVGPDGTVYVTIPEEGQVWAYGADGVRRSVWQLPPRDGVPARPVGIDLGPDGELWVTDVANGRVLRLLSEG